MSTSTVSHDWVASAAAETSPMVDKPTRRSGAKQKNPGPRFCSQVSIFLACGPAGSAGTAHQGESGPAARPGGVSRILRMPSVNAPRNDLAELIGLAHGGLGEEHQAQMGEEPDDHVGAWKRALQVTSPCQWQGQIK